MFGLSREEKLLKEFLTQNGCDSSVFRRFKAVCDMLRKRLPQVETRYRQCREKTQRIQNIARELETLFVDGGGSGVKQLKALAEQLCEISGGSNKKNQYTHEFLVSSQDREFQSTVDTLAKRLGTLSHNSGEELFLQSEVENLLSMAEEVLERESPDLRAYTYFLSEHQDSELYEMTAEKKREYIKWLFRIEVFQPVFQCTADQEMLKKLMSDMLKVSKEEI